MVCQLNAKFIFNNNANISYKDSTTLQQMLLKKDQKFKWEKEEDAYQLLTRLLEDPATLQPYIIDRDTHIVTNASEHGIKGSIYQKKYQAQYLCLADHT